MEIEVNIFLSWMGFHWPELVGPQRPQGDAGPQTCSRS